MYKCPPNFQDYFQVSVQKFTRYPVAPAEKAANVFFSKAAWKFIQSSAIRM
jgi:hypothetical protein